MFGLIDTNNSRRFQGPERQVLAIFDHCRSFTTYAAVGVDRQGRLVFASEPRTYWADEVTEIRE